MLRIILVHVDWYHDFVANVENTDEILRLVVHDVTFVLVQFSTYIEEILVDYRVVNLMNESFENILMPRERTRLNQKRDDRFIFVCLFVQLTIDFLHDDDV